jgi:DNA polymerase-3 subunit beta
MKQVVGAVVKQSGITTVDVSILTNIVRKIDSSTISMLEEDSVVKIKSKKSEFKLHTIDYNKFPSFSGIQESNINFKIKAKEFVNLIKYTQFSMLSNETRYNLNGICIHTSDINGEKKIASASTDGHRLSAVYTEDSYNDIKDFNIIIPAKLVSQILNVFNDSKLASSEIDISIDENKIQICCEGVSIISKLINATFPEYNTLIPKDNDIILKINSKILSDAIERVITVTSDKFRGIKININKDKLEILAYGEGRGDANEVIDKSADEGYEYSGNDEISIGFNSRYVLDIVSNFSNSTFEMCMKDRSSSILFRSDKLKNATFVVMPVKI